MYPRVAYPVGAFLALCMTCAGVSPVRALEATGARALNLGGGVACNRDLRARLDAECRRIDVVLRIPSPRICADNAAMIAQLGAWRLERGESGAPELDAAASLEESGLAAAAAPGR